MAETVRDDRDHDATQPETPVSPLESGDAKDLPRQPSRNEEFDTNQQPVSPIMSRKSSLESDRHSNVSGLTSHLPSNPTNVNPPPAYIAQFGASQVVGEHQAVNRPPSSSDTEDEDEKKKKHDVHFTEPALALVNAFLDQMLYSFLSTARSTSLQALRPAVMEVLKPKLAREAIASAEDELAALAGGEDEEEEASSKRKGAERNRNWDLELVWKRTRLRVMVYMRLGEMEDDDEQRYIKEEELFQSDERRKGSSRSQSHVGLVSWAAAIFLTSVLEYLAEQTLEVAGQAAYTRARRQSRTQRLTSSTEVQSSDELVVEEHDVQKIALNSTLGRLWRTWQKALRNPGQAGTPTHRSSNSINSITRSNRDNMVSALSHNRDNSFSTAHEGSVASESRPMSRAQDDTPEVQYPEHILAANIPLPMGNQVRDIDEIVVPGLARDLEVPYEEEPPDEPYPELLLGGLVALPEGDVQRDVDEIEVPGLARDPDEDKDSITPIPIQTVRRKSFTDSLPYKTFAGLPTPDSSTPTSPVEDNMPLISRQRSMSLPTPARSPLLAQDGSEEPPVAKKSMYKGFGGLPEDAKKPEAEGDEAAEPEEMETADKEVAEDPSGETGDESAVEASPAISPGESTTSQAKKREFPWIGPSAVAGTAVAAASAAAAWAIGSKSKPAAEQVAQDTDKDLLDVKKDASQQSLSVKDVEELDKRKSLADIKSLVGQSAASSGRESPRGADSQTSSRKVSRSPAVTRTASDDSETLGGKNKEVISEAEGPEDAIGVAQTSDAVVPVAVAAEGAQARDTAKRPPRLVLRDSVQKPLPSPTNKASPSATPRTPRQFLDLTEQTSPTPTLPSPVTKASPKAISSASADPQESPSVEKAPRQSSSSVRGVAEKSGSRHGSTPSTPSTNKKFSPDEVQEHPMVQRLQTLKGSEPIATTEAEKVSPITSASIKGPADFDSFVQGGDTLKYTLTPEHVRDEPVDSSTRYPPPTPKSPKHPSSSDSRAGRSKPATATASEDEGRTSLTSKRRSSSRPSPRNTSVSNRSGLMAREPRVMTDSTRDFADFIRSTGPNKDAAIYPILANASQSSLHSLRSAHINGASGPGAKDDKDVPPVPPIPSRGKTKTPLQPRAPTTVGDSSELIDFIRAGPDQEGQHRIPRNVAPFRTTMDSDQFKDLSDRPSSERPGPSDVAPSVQSTASMNSFPTRTSTNSRSALLSNANQPGQSSQPSKPAAASKSVAFQDGDAGRRQYRNKDPYAFLLDDSEEDNDDEMLLSLPKSRGPEENMIDFLNKAEPPSSTEPPRPLIDPNSAQARAIISNARANAAAANAAKAVNGGTTAGSASNGDGRAIPRGLGPKGYATTVGSQQSQIKSTVSTPGSKMTTRTAGSKSRAGGNFTNDLVDFLRTGPENEADSAPAPSVGRSTKPTTKADPKPRKKSSGMGLFSRPKKQTYMDMP